MVSDLAKLFLVQFPFQVIVSNTAININMKQIIIVDLLGRTKGKYLTASVFNYILYSEKT